MSEAGCRVTGHLILCRVTSQKGPVGLSQVIACLEQGRAGVRCSYERSSRRPGGLRQRCLRPQRRGV